MPASDFSQAFLAVAAETNKQLVIAVEIEGLSTILTSGTIYKKIAYGDPITYGQAGIVYGGLLPYGDFKSLLSLDKSSLTLQQKVEPEQGRSSVTMLTLAFIDQDQFITQLMSPGVLIPDLLGALITVRIGFPSISYPGDYGIIFRGRCSAYDLTAGLGTIQISDPNVVRRQQLFYMAQGVAASAIAPTDTTIYANTLQFFTQQILGPNGSYDPAVTTYITIDSEVIAYPATGLNTAASAFTGLTRGARGTTAASHSVGATINASVQVQDHFIDMALKYMLSGWQGPYLSDLPIAAFVNTSDPITGIQAQGFMISKDANKDYGIAPGDYITITGAANSANNGQCQVVLFLNTSTGNNRVIITNKTFVQETPTSAVFSVRSQYDTYPDNLGLQLMGTEVDVLRHQYLKNTFLSSAEYSLKFYKTQNESSGKTFIESEVYFPFGCYSLTRYGQCSMQLTHPPIADQSLAVLDASNVVNPQNIKPQRAVNNRKFFNEIDLSMDYSDTGTPLNIIKFIYTTSLNIIGISSILPIQATGLRSSLTTTTTVNRIFDYILSRYENGAVVISLEVNFAVGVQIEAGDVVEISDNGFLQIANFLTGQRNLGSQLFEVIDRSLNLGTGKCTLQVVAGIGAEATDRYATISPASILTTGTTQSLLVLQDSFGTATPGQEASKWSSYLGLIGLVHDTNWTQSATCVLASISTTVPNAINVTGINIPASAGPFPGWILDINSYATDTPEDQQPFKIAFCFFDPSVVATSGISATSFQVASSGIGLFQVGLPVLLHDANFSHISNEANVLTVNSSTNVVTVATTLGFTPSAGMIVDLIGFGDGGGPYRYI